MTEAAHLVPRADQPRVVEDSYQAHQRHLREMADPEIQRPRLLDAVSRVKAAQRAPTAARTRLVALQDVRDKAVAAAAKLEAEAAELDTRRRGLIREAAAAGPDSAAQVEATKLRARRDTVLDVHAIAVEAAQAAQADVDAQEREVAAAEEVVATARKAARDALSALVYAEMMEAVRTAMARYARVWRQGDLLPPSFDALLGQLKHEQVKQGNRGIPFPGEEFGVLE